jgi:hypothetical protein
MSTATLFHQGPGCTTGMTHLPPEASERPGAGSPEEPEEVLVADSRAGLTPADMVDRKLLYLLRGAGGSGSHLRMGGRRGRGGANDGDARTYPKGAGIMFMSCEVILRWDATPEQRRALGIALWPWCSRAAGSTDVHQHLHNPARADLLACQLPTAEPVALYAGLPRIQFLVQGDPARDRQSLLESLHRAIPRDAVADVRVDGISWCPAEATRRTTTAVQG